MPTPKSSNYKISAVKYYLSDSKNQFKSMKYSVVLKDVYKK